MRQMKNVRTGQTAAYDQSLVDSGRWVEVAQEQPPATDGKQKKSLKLTNTSAKGSLEVQPNGEPTK